MIFLYDNIAIKILLCTYLRYIIMKLYFHIIRLFFLLLFKAPTAAVAPASTESAPKEEKKKEEPDEPESDEDMGFGM